MFISVQPIINGMVAITGNSYLVEAQRGEAMQTNMFIIQGIASCGGQINLKGRADLGCFNLRGAVIAMLDDRDISLNDLLIRDQGRGMV